jgi:pyruvate kinase
MHMWPVTTVNALVQDGAAACVIAHTVSGDSVRAISGERPSLPVHAAASDVRVRNQLALSWGISPLLVPAGEGLEKAVELLQQQKALKPGAAVITVSGDRGAKQVELRVA